MNVLTLSAAKPVVARALNMCPTDDRVVDFLNEAQQRLLNRPTRAVGCDMSYRFKATASQITLPRQIKTVERWLWNQWPGAVRPEWFDFGFNGYGRWEDDRPCDAILLKDMGRACCFNDPLTSAKDFIRVTTDVTEAAATYLWLYGYDENNQWIRSLIGGTWYDGERVDLSAAPVVTTNKFTALVRAHKDVTKGIVRGYEWDGALVIQSLFAYEPSETDPVYRRILIPGMDDAVDSDEDQYVTVFARLQHIPVSADNDAFVIGNLPALKLMCMSIKAEEAGQLAEAQALSGSAIAELEGELASYVGDGVGLQLNMEEGFGAGRVRSIV